MLDGLCAETSCVFCPVSWCLICRRDSVVLSCLIEKKKKSAENRRNGLVGGGGQGQGSKGGGPVATGKGGQWG